MDDITYRLVDGGWAISQNENGYTLTAQFYCRTAQTAWPKRGEVVPTTGSIAVPSAFAFYVISEVTVTPLTSAGPWLVDVTAAPKKMGANDGDTLKKERKAMLEMRQYSVKAGQLKDSGIRGEHTFEFLIADFYESTGTGKDLAGSYPGPIVTGIPTWCNVRDTTGKWKLFSCVKEVVYDTNGVSLLKHIKAELIGVPDWMDTRWSAKYGTMAFSSL